MSKSYENTIPVFAGTDELRRRVMRIVTDSRRPEEPKDPETDNVFAIYRQFAAPDAVEATRRRYLQGGLAYGEIKQELVELLDCSFGEARQRYRELKQDKELIDQILARGAEKARAIAAPVIAKVRGVVGVGPR